VRDSVLLDGCAIGAGARVSGCVLAPGVSVDAGAELAGAIVGRGERVPNPEMIG
jgi:ADP-glucose pyrophosphorylase